ncbi:hypothetical protein BDZ89DRAFT_1173939 [Hymenopellis radicata]|nr:hypothetical protein BDZ89DRAFT_1173939 [Hymenopellis radicata]
MNVAPLNLDTLNIHDALPVLTPDNNIRVRDIVRNIDRFVIWNLKATFARNIHYEHDSYGAINDYLHSIFPPSRRFSITPQSLLREAVPAPDLSDTHSSQATNNDDSFVGNEAADTSLGPYGAYHRSRDHAGQEPGKKFIDFTASKVSATSVSVPEHTLLTFVEVKREGDNDWQSHAQMVVYMLRVWENPDRAPNFRAFLLNVREHKIIEYFFGLPGNNGQAPAVHRVDRRGVEVQAPGSHRLNGDVLTEKLANISRQFWN